MSTMLIMVVYNIAGIWRPVVASLCIYTRWSARRGNCWRMHLGFLQVQKPGSRKKRAWQQEVDLSFESSSDSTSKPIKI